MVQECIHANNVNICHLFSFRHGRNMPFMHKLPHLLALPCKSHYLCIGELVSPIRCDYKYTVYLSGWVAGCLSIYL